MGCGSSNVPAEVKAQEKYETIKERHESENLNGFHGVNQESDLLLSDIKSALDSSKVVEVLCIEDSNTVSSSPIDNLSVNSIHETNAGDTYMSYEGLTTRVTVNEIDCESETDIHISSRETDANVEAESIWRDVGNEKMAVAAMIDDVKVNSNAFDSTMSIGVSTIEATKEVEPQDNIKVNKAENDISISDDPTAENGLNEATPPLSPVHKKIGSGLVARMAGLNNARLIMPGAPRPASTRQPALRPDYIDDKRFDKPSHQEGGNIFCVQLDRARIASINRRLPRKIKSSLLSEVRDFDRSSPES